MRGSAAALCVAVLLAACSTPQARVSPSPGTTIGISPQAFSSPAPSPTLPIPNCNYDAPESYCDTSANPACVAPMPVAAQSPSPASSPSPGLPRQVWVNTALGANVRATPSTTAARIAFWPQLTTGANDQVSTDSSGASWERITAAGVTGWVRGDLITDEPVSYYDGGQSFHLPGWSILVPAVGLLGTLPGEVFFDGSDWRLVVRSATTAAQLPSDLGFDIIAFHPELYDRSAQVSVWTYSTTKHVVRVTTDICRWGPQWAAQGNGWPYLAVVEVTSGVRTYQFSFLTPEPDPPVVSRILDSINISG